MTTPLSPLKASRSVLLAHMERMENEMASLERVREMRLKQIAAIQADWDRYNEALETKFGTTTTKETN